MPHRLAWALVVPVIVMSGCLGGASGPSGDPDPGAGGDGDEAEGDLGAFFGLPPGVDTLPLPPGAAGVVSGVVYDVTNGRPVTDAFLTAVCFDALGLPANAFQVPVGEHGTFTLEGVTILAACNEVQYLVEASGYDLVEPLTSRGLASGFQHVLQAGMRPSPP